MTIQNVFGSTPPGSVNVSADTITLAHIFEVAQAGNVIGARWYEGDSGSPVSGNLAALWDINGTLLASKTFNTPGSDGWFDISFDSPIAVSANTPYLIGIFNNNSHQWAATFGGLMTDVVSGDITFLGYLNDPMSIGEGRFDASGSFTFPTSASGAHSSYGVDLQFEVSAPPADIHLTGDTDFSWVLSGTLSQDIHVQGAVGYTEVIAGTLSVRKNFSGAVPMTMAVSGVLSVIDPSIVLEAIEGIIVPADERGVRVPYDVRGVYR